MSTDYVTLAAMKVTLALPNTTWDADVSASITAASRAIDGLCDGRRFYLDPDATSVRYYSPDGNGRELDIDDLNELASLMTDTDGDGTFDTTWTLNTDFNLEPLNAQADPNDVWPFTRIRVRPTSSLVFRGFPRSVQVTGQFGWAAVPQAIVEGTTLLTERLFKIKREAPLGVLAYQDVAIRIAKADPNLQMMIGQYMKHAVAVA